MYIFLDESGQFAKNDKNDYFVIGSFSVDDPRKTEKDFRKWFSKKFPKKMRDQSEIKWSATGITNVLRLKTIQVISDHCAQIRYGFLNRNNIPISYRNKKNKIDSGILYTIIVAEVLKQYFPTDDNEIYIFCDQRSLKGMSKHQFESKIASIILPLCTLGTLVKVEMIDSVTNLNIQIADWISGALARFLEKGVLGEDCYTVLKSRIICEGIEFFKKR